MARMQYALLMLLTILGGSVVAQEQPPVAENNQDEIVEIPAVPAADGRVTIFRSGDKAEINDYISHVVELEHGVALELLPHVLKAVKLEKGSARVMKYAPPDGGETRYFMQVVTTREQMPSIIETLETLDLPGVKSSTGVARYSIRMRYRRASDMAQVLQGTTLSGEGKVFADDITNTLFIEDSHSDGNSDLEQVEFFDVPPPQIEFDVQLIEVRQSDSSDLGLDWEAWKQNLGGQIQSVGNVFEGGEAFSRLDWLLTLDAPVLAEFLNYAVQNDNAKLVHRARVTGNNLQPARILNARHLPDYGYERIEREPGLLSESNQVADASGKDGVAGDRVVAIVPPTQYVRRDLGRNQEGIALSILPLIGTEMVTAEVDVMANVPTGYDEQGHPVLSTQSFPTVVSLKDMQTLRLGTIEKEYEVKTRRGLPGLSAIPGLRYLFSTEKTVKEKAYVHIIATPCYCNVVLYQARMAGAPGNVLETGDYELPEYIKLDMLPLE